jgi:hypothetical protein
MKKAKSVGQVSNEKTVAIIGRVKESCIAKFSMSTLLESPHRRLAIASPLSLLSSLHHG